MIKDKMEEIKSFNKDYDFKENNNIELISEAGDVVYNRCILFIKDKEVYNRILEKFNVEDINCLEDIDDILTLDERENRIEEIEGSLDFTCCTDYISKERLNDLKKQGFKYVIENDIEFNETYTGTIQDYKIDSWDIFAVYDEVFAPLYLFDNGDCELIEEELDKVIEKYRNR
ncbi:hypothetical protein [Clostridium butyricum]|uniref:Uncharacterized protein n=1 Tax=Clostridium butyricum TaxID=1492 RepID=A0A6N3FFE0_CLOBU|nr:hypothetical protein AK964_21075 [Clostridium butyricum]